MPLFQPDITERDIRTYTNNYPTDTSTGDLVKFAGEQAMDAYAGKVTADMEEEIEGDIGELLQDHSLSILQGKDDIESQLTAQIIKKMKSQQKGVAQGVLTPAQFKSRVAASTREAINRMPGRADEINRAASQLVSGYAPDIKQIEDSYETSAAASAEQYKQMHKLALKYHVVTLGKPDALIWAEIVERQNAAAAEKQRKIDVNKRSVARAEQAHGRAETGRNATRLYRKNNYGFVNLALSSFDAVVADAKNTGEDPITALNTEYVRQQAILDEERDLGVSEEAINTRKVYLKNIHAAQVAVADGTTSATQWSNMKQILSDQHTIEIIESLPPELRMQLDLMKMYSSVYNQNYAVTSGAATAAMNAVPEMQARLMGLNRPPVSRGNPGKTTAQLGINQPQQVAHKKEGKPGLANIVAEQLHNVVNQYEKERGEDTWEVQDYKAIFESMATKEILKGLAEDTTLAQRMAPVANNFLMVVGSGVLKENIPQSLYAININDEGELFIEATNRSMAANARSLNSQVMSPINTAIKVYAAIRKLSPKKVAEEYVSRVYGGVEATQDKVE